MSTIDRARRAEIQRRAKRIRHECQSAGWDISCISAAIMTDLPDVFPLEAWRLAHGWSRGHVVAAIGDLYQRDGLAVPLVNSSMLCRWEHGETAPGADYRHALCRLYQTSPEQLGLRQHYPVTTPLRRGWSTDNEAASASETGGADDHNSVRAGEGNATLNAVRESVLLALTIEGPAGGPRTRDQLDHAIHYYDMNYSRCEPGLLAVEVGRCREMVVAMMRHDHSTPERIELRRLGGWLSALLGNLTFHAGDYTAAKMHLGIATALAVDIGHNTLISWTLAAQSMLARYQGRFRLALAFAHKATTYADSPLKRAQAIAWAELPALTGLHRSDEARAAIIRAQREMDASAEHHRAGRFGFDSAELELHLAEAALALGDATATAHHAHTSLSHTPVGSPGWAAAVLTQARNMAHHRQPDDAAELGLHVLDVIPPPMLRETSRHRLTQLDNSLMTLIRPGRAALTLNERLHTTSITSVTSTPPPEVPPGDCAANGVFGSTHRAEVRWDGH